MKRIFILLTAVISIFTFTDVKAEETTEEITTENSYLLRDKLLEINSTYTEENYPYFLTYTHSSREGIWITISSEGFGYSSSGVLTISGNKITYYYLDGSLTNYSAITIKYNELHYSNVDIYIDTSNTELLFQKNYPLEEDVEPTPTPTETPIPTDKPNTSELEICNSFVCDISDSILDDFDDEQFPFVKTIIRFLLLLLVVFVIVSPFWLLYKAVRWFM